MKKTLALILSLMLALAIMPTALAAGDVAQIGTTGYATLAEAVAAANSGDTITMLADVTIISTITINNSITLDLNGHNITGVNSRVFNLTAGTLDITGTGTISSTHTQGDSFAAGSSVIRVGTDNTSADATLTIGKDVTISSAWCFGVAAFGFDSAYNSATKAYGRTLTVNVNGTITTGGIAGCLSGNGTAGKGNTVFNINSSAKLIATGTETSAIYHPQTGTVNIVDGAYLSGTGMGIGIKSGTLNMSGGTIRCTGANTAPTVGFSNGINASGAALQLEANTAYAGNMDINITGGSLISDNGYSIYEYIGVGTATAVSNFDISAGTFKGIISISQALDGTAGRPSITGGTFSADPSTYVASGYAAVTVGSSFVVKPVGSLSGKITSNGTDAIENATVTLNGSSTITDANGAYSFDSVPAGAYSLVVAKDGATKTVLVTVSGATTCNVTFDTTKQSIVTDNAGLSVAANGLSAIAEDNSNDNVLVTLTVASDNNTAAQTAISDIADTNSINYYDIKR